MRPLLFLIALCFSFPALGLSSEAREFMSITEQLGPVQCEKRKLRRAIALAEAERRDEDARKLRQRFAALDRDPKTARLEQRLAELGQRMSNGKGGTRDPEDLNALDRQRVEAFYRCQ